MKLTNQYGAPDVFIKAIEADPYDKGEADFSVTGLLQPPQITRLWKENEDLLTSDVRDEVWKLLGSGVHAVLEGHGDGTVEQRLFSEHEGVRISGAVDLVKDGHVTDYKVGIGRRAERVKIIIQTARLFRFQFHSGHRRDEKGLCPNG
mgnify:CR=1 FL=1